MCIVYDDGCALFGKREGDASSNAAVGSGDDGNFLIQLSHDISPFLISRFIK
jgi:hypothetical protein